MGDKKQNLLLLNYLKRKKSLMPEEKTEKMRLFIGSKVSFSILDEETSAKLCEFYSCPVKFVEKDNIHLTWKFIGGTKAEKLDEIKEINLEAVEKVSDIKIKFEKFEIWPSGKKPSLIVLTGADLNGNATKLYQKLDKKFEKLGIKRENRKFIPHITVARFKIKQKPEEKFVLPEWLSFNTVESVFSKLCIFQSIPTKNGSVYTPVQSFLI